MAPILISRDSERSRGTLRLVFRRTTPLATDMEGVPTSTEGQRILAVIVFTDVVGFTKLASKNEQRAFEVVHQHLNLMSEMCVRNGGQVLKSTGDGLLMSFASAVQAVQCALQIQHDLHERNKLVPTEEWVQHRIGIHLGDIIVTESDVFGDGVNVAARLQQEAKPGAICLSRTVHDVVKGKLPVEPQYLGPRHLKNVIEPVMVWQFPPIGEATTGDGAQGKTTAEIFRELGPSEEGGAEGAKGSAMVVASVVCVIAAIGLIWMFTRPAGDSSAAVEDTKSKTKSTVVKPAPPEGDKGKVEPPKTEETQVPASLADNSELKTKLAEFLKTYDFSGFVSWLETFEPARNAEGEAMIAKYKKLAEFRTWMESQIAAAKPETPLVLANSRIYAGQDGGVFVEDAAGAQLKFFQDLPPSTLMELVGAAVVKGQAPPPTPLSAIDEWCMLFAAEFGVAKPNLGQK
ncbi:MAG: hypothetical protein HONBIEJF_02188 [Fimbriimonadaceae bacterium]|nr:hypothetical protein [Fimbriimonadaceae bacterium]